MIKYVIHACPPRMWYVDEYLVPSLINQGITNEQIDIRCDRYKRGNLDQCMQIFSVMQSDGGSWHLQDDVIVCNDFKKRTEEFADYNGVVCGFAWEKDNNYKKVGLVNLDEMWWSFPCIYIPDKYARECSRWFYEEARHLPKYNSWFAAGQYDDMFFHEFLKIYYPDEKILHLKPNLVDHIDYLLGGTTVRKIMRPDIVRAQYFEDQKLVDDLTNKLKNRGKNQ